MFFFIFLRAYPGDGVPGVTGRGITRGPKALAMNARVKRPSTQLSEDKARLLTLPNKMSVERKQPVLKAVTGRGVCDWEGYQATFSQVSAILKNMILASSSASSLPIN